MTPAGAPGQPWRLRSFETLASTSDLLIQLANAGEPAGLALLAHRQTAGRGSRGRAWTSPAGNLALSVLLRPTGPASHAGQWALLAAVALGDALRLHAPDAALSLKWPNDVLLDGRKLGGILIDGAAAPNGGLLWLVIGFGANLGAAPEVADRVAAGLGSAATPAQVAATLLDRLDHWRRVVLLDGFREAVTSLTDGRGVDVVVDVVGGPDARPSAQRLVGLGLLLAAPTAWTGWAEWSGSGQREQRVGVVHVAAVGASVALYTASWTARRRDRHGRQERPELEDPRRRRCLACHRRRRRRPTDRVVPRQQSRAGPGAAAVPAAAAQL